MVKPSKNAQGGGSKHAGGKSKKKQLKVKGGTASRYTTRNQALNRLQLKLADFRRLCILKGIHPREPKKKVKGQGKTYYHVKDINFLAHEPLLEKFRHLRAYERKIKKAKAKKAYHQIDRLEERKPQYALDHLVKERYPSFVDAIRDLDDPLTLVHLFSLLPADKRHGIPNEVVTRARTLGLEFQSFVTKTHALRKVFISVKGIYYQASIYGQEVTWLTPHALAQTLPEDVDYRVMLTFLEFYIAMMGFVNYKLYYDRSFRYPPLLDTKLEDAAGGIVAVIHDLAEKVAGGPKHMAGQAKKKSAQAKETEARLGSLQAKLALAGGDNEMDDEEEAAAAAKAARDGDDEDMEREAGDEGEEEDEEKDLADLIAQSAGADPLAREDAKLCSTLFKGLVFFLQREVPRDMMVFIVRSFGGEVCWEGEGSPYDPADGGVTHHVCDRPMEGKMVEAREYIQPQWVVDCANWRILIPTGEYTPGKPPPPHLSPFVNAEDEGYTPDYQETLQRLQAQAKAAREGRSIADVSEEAGTRALTAKEEREEEEKAYKQDLERELKGIPYSRSLQDGEEASDDDEESQSGDEDEEEGDEDEESGDEDDDEEEDDEDGEDDEDESDYEGKTADEEAPGTKRKVSRLTQEMAMRDKDIVINKRIKDMGEEAEMDAMRYVMLPRKKRELYKAMQLGLAKKEARVNELQERKDTMKKEGKYGHEPAPAAVEKAAAAPKSAAKAAKAGGKKK
eukprot:CAMPEP_0197575710 /NCGR_PEP_ID=MMETSP1326-20131121/1012_1 /TAXON_ID=1155430 /ORGANISM="Genus nov. species nov., Strain RCC2288" /LENGTH=734 /DNA_ID=CAMNT_0043138523 /DNA_START=104 /DNA_END=2308 /DNA_ORIENTATION=-